MKRGLVSIGLEGVEIMHRGGGSQGIYGAGAVGAHMACSCMPSSACGPRCVRYFFGYFLEAVPGRSFNSV